MSTTTTSMAAVAMAAAIVLAGPPRPRLSRPVRVSSRASSTGVLLTAGAVAIGAAVLLLPIRRVLLSGIAAGIVLAVVAQLARRRRRAAIDRRRDAVHATCDEIAGDVAAGLPPLTAVERAARHWAELGPAAQAARLGADVPDALREIARLPGAEHLADVAAAWQVSHETGAALSGTLGSLASVMHEQRSLDRTVAAELAAAHATARLMAVLPIFVVLLGIGVGGDPVHFLLDTTLGSVTLVVGLSLEALGMWWMNRITDGVRGA